MPALLIACGLTFLLYVGSYMRLPLVPLFARDLGATIVETGQINAGFMLVATLLSVPFGLLSDRVGRRRMILAGMAIAGGASFSLLFATTPFHVGAIYLVAGAGLAAFSPAMMSFVGDTSKPESVGRAYGWYTAVLYAGMSVGPALGGLAGGHGFPLAFAISGAMILSAFLFGVVRLEEPPHTASPAVSRLRDDAREVVSNRAVVACWLATFGATFAWGALFAFFPLYAKERGVGVEATGLVFAVQAATNAIVRIPAGALIDRCSGTGRLIFLGTATLAATVAATGFVAGPFELCLLFAAIGGAMAVGFTAIGAVLSGATETRVRGLAMGGYNTAIYGGFATASALLGAVIEAGGFRAGFAAAGAVGLLCAAGSGLLLSSRAGRVR